MKQLKIAVLWHQHQPYYRIDDEFALPWVRMHAVKDYFDLPELLHEFPDIKQTFNLAPSLMLQISEYLSGAAHDKIEVLTLLNSEELTDENKSEIIDSFFICNRDNLINPYLRYRELADRAEDRAAALNTFSAQDWRDLQVWYNLAWIGQFSKNSALAKRMFYKERNYTEEEKRTVLSLHKDIMSKIIPQMSLLMSLNQIEVSCSPMYHPILPLLCSSSSALEAMPGLPMPDPEFNFPEDADRQLKDGINYYTKLFGENPKGMWPSEGSISDEALSLMAKNGIKWAASDEMILANTMKDAYQPGFKFFPHRFKTNHGDIALLFRDHYLSDRIGFVYSNWAPQDAANDFLNHLKNIKNEIVQNYGEQALASACVPIILDGENCWEFYPENGVPFLRELYRRLDESNEFTTVTAGEAATEDCLNFMPDLEHIRAGSWINSNFSIWIGDEDDRKAWSLLSQARALLDIKQQLISKEEYDEAYNELMIAEGSDWFWWYGPEHSAPNKADFDVMFRLHLSRYYELIGEEIPAALEKPLSDQVFKKIITKPVTNISPSISGLLDSAREWENAGVYDARSVMSAMHQIGEKLASLKYGYDDTYLYFRLELLKNLHLGDIICLEINEPFKAKISISEYGFEFEAENPIAIEEFTFARKDTIDMKFLKDPFKTVDSDKSKIAVAIRTLSDKNEIVYPRQGFIEIDF